MENKIENKTTSKSTMEGEKTVLTVKKKKVYTLGIIFVVILLFLASFLLPKPHPAPSPKMSHITPATNQTILFFNPGKTTISLAQTENTYNLPLYILTKNNNVAGVEFHMHYDPTIFTNVSIGQGSFLPNSIILENVIDKTKGNISFAEGITPTGKPASGQGVLVILHYQINPQVATSLTLPVKTSMTFLPGTAVGDKAYHYTSLNAAYGEAFTITR